jgi:hypothetical protein
MDSLLPAVISICFGVYFIVSRDWVAASAVEFDYRALGVRVDKKLYEVAFLVGGIGFILLGLLSLSGIIQLPPLR